jgi:hypothetical protein
MIVILLSLVLFVVGRILTETVFLIIIVVFNPSEINFFFYYLSGILSLNFWITFAIRPYILALFIITTAGIIAYVSNLAAVGAKLMTWLYIKLASGRIGSLLSLTLIFDFAGDWMVEQKTREEINLKDWRGMFSELVKERAVDVIAFPALVSIFILVIVSKIVDLNPNNLIFNEIPAIDFAAISVGFFVVLLLCFYIPSMWILADGEIKKINFGKTGDVDYVFHVASSYKQGLATFIGFSGFVGFGKLAVQALVKTEQSLQSEGLGTNVTASTADTILIYLATYVYALGFFLIMASWLLPGISLAMLRYMKSHGKYVAQTREKVVIKGICREGTLTPALNEYKTETTDYVEIKDK